ncbi:MAG: DUF2062 domain-containing protein [Cyanobacteria bacterium J06641_5]
MAGKQGRYWRGARYLYLRVLRAEGSTGALARGLAAGVFAGMFPFFGVQTVMGVGLAFVLRGNKLAAAAGTWISNPFTYAPIYWFNYQIGRQLLGDRAAVTVDWQSPRQLLQSGVEIARPLLVGCCAIGAIAAIATYGISLRVLPRLRRRSRGR